MANDTTKRTFDKPDVYTYFVFLQFTSICLEYYLSTILQTFDIWLGREVTHTYQTCLLLS